MNYMAQRRHDADLDFRSEILITELMEQYENVLNAKSTHPEDISYEKVLLKAISTVIHFNLTQSDFDDWQRSIMGNTHE